MRIVDSVVVRRAEVSDTAGVDTVIERAIRGSSLDLYSREQIEAWATGRTVAPTRKMIESTVGYVAVSDGLVVGFSNLDGDDVDQLYVDPAVDGNGVARMLFGAVEAEAIERGLSALTATASLRAVPAFHNFGFAEQARADRPFNGAIFQVIRMRKQLSADAELPD